MSDNLYDLFETDPKAEVDGVWMEVGATARFKVGRISDSNKTFMATLNRRTGKRDLVLDTDAEQIEKATREAIVEACIPAWEGVTDREGNPLVCNFENKKQVFEDLPELFTRVVQFGRKHTNYRLKALEQDAGN